MVNDLEIFVVDDESIIAFTLGKILRSNGFNAQSFTDPFEALDAALKKAPGLLLSDVMMPEMSGVELAIHMQAICPECKVLLFSGQASTDDLLRNARQAGHEFEILQKPVHPHDLLAAIRQQHIRLLD